LRREINPLLAHQTSIRNTRTVSVLVLHRWRWAHTFLADACWKTADGEGRAQREFYQVALEFIQGGAKQGMLRCAAKQHIQHWKHRAIPRWCTMHNKLLVQYSPFPRPRTSTHSHSECYLLALPSCLPAFPHLPHRCPTELVPCLACSSHRINDL